MSAHRPVSWRLIRPLRCMKYSPHRERRPGRIIETKKLEQSGEMAHVDRGCARIPTQMYIDGEWCDAPAGKTLAVINPADESVVAEVAYGSAAEAGRAIDAASRAFPAWRALSAYDRAKVLKKTAELMRERVETIGRTLTQEQGKPLAEAKTEVLHAADTFEWFAEEGKRSIRPDHSPCQRRQALLRHQTSGRRRLHDHTLELPGRTTQPQDRCGHGGRLHGG